MSLKEAADLLGIKPNGVRARFKTSKIRGERDNEGKIYVYLDPDAAEQERVQRGASMKPSLQPSNTSLVNALEAHIETLREEVETLRAQLHTLWERADSAARLEGEKAGLERENASLREQLRDREQDRDHWRQQAMTFPTERPDRERAEGFWARRLLARLVRGRAVRPS